MRRKSTKPPKVRRWKVPKGSGKGEGWIANERKKKRGRKTAEKKGLEFKKRLKFGGVGGEKGGEKCEGRRSRSLTRWKGGEGMGEKKIAT